MPVSSNILVAVDGSLQSRIATDMAVFLSKAFSSRVTLIHVVSKEVPALSGELYSPREDTVPVNQATYQFPRAVRLYRPRESVFPDQVVGEMTAHLHENGQATLTEGAALFSAAGIAAKQKLLEGARAPDAIMKEIEAGDYDLILMGNSGGEENEPDTHLGSVADEVSMRSKISVLVVREKIRISKILATVDGSTKDAKAIEYTSELAKKTGAKVALLHVQEKSMLRAHPEIEEIGRRILNQSAGGIGGEVEQKLVAGDPAKVIVQTAKAGDFDLVVMGTGKLGAVRHFLLGNVADHVLHHATVPVLLAK